MGIACVDSVLHQYVLAHNYSGDYWEQKIIATTQVLELAKMQIPLDQARFMQFLVKITQSKYYLEIGAFTGLSAYVIIKAMGAEAKATILEKNLQYLAIAEKFWIDSGIINQIEIFPGLAADTLIALIKQNRSYDFIFIDADKSNTMNYYEAALKLIKSQGLILIDNTIMQSQVLHQSKFNYVNKIKQFNDFLLIDSRVEIIMLTIADGLTVAMKK